MCFEESDVVRYEADGDEGEGGEELGKVALSRFDRDDTADEEQETQPGNPRHSREEAAHAQHHRQKAVIVHRRVLGLCTRDVFEVNDALRPLHVCHLLLVKAAFHKMDLLRLSATERAAISARLDQSLAALSDGSVSPSPPSSPEPASPLPLEEPDLGQSAAWQEYVAARQEQDRETEEIYAEWKEELKGLQRGSAAPLLLETPLEDVESESEDFEPVPSPSLQESIQSEVYDPVPTAISHSYDPERLEEAYQREREANQMREEEDLSMLIYLHYKEAEKTRVEKEKKRVRSEQKKSQEICLKAQLAAIDSDKKRKREAIRQAAEAQKQAEEARVRAELAEKQEEAREKRDMQREERLSQAAAAYLEAQEELKSREIMREEDDYSRSLSKFAYLKRAKSSFRVNPPPIKQFKLQIDCGESNSPSIPLISLVKLDPVFPPSSFPLPPPRPLADFPPPAGSTPLSDSLPYDLSPNTCVLELKCENITHINGLQGFSSLRTLSLSMNQITEAGNLPQGLVLLDLSLNRVEKLPKVDLPALLELVLDSNVIGSLEHCGDCRNLRTLSVQNNNISSMRGIESFPLLQRLNLYRNSITDPANTCFDHNPYLTHLNLGRNRLRNVAFHSHFKLLRSLILYENQIERLEPINSPLISELWLNGNRLTQVDFLGTANVLEIVRLDQNSIRTVGSFVAPSLREVNLSDNDLEDMQGLGAVLRAAQGLEVLEFADNPISQRLSALGWTFQAGTKRNTSQRSAIYRRLGYEYAQSELWLRAIGRNEVRSLALQSTLRNWTQGLCFVHYNALASLTDTEVLSYESLAYQYKEHGYKLKRAARLIQGWWRLKLRQIRALRERYNGKMREIVKIQGLFRGALCRKRYGRKSKYPVNVIVRIQAWYRGCRLRHRLKTALENAKFVDPELAELEEVAFEDYTDLDLGLKVPAFLDLQSFLQPLSESRLPPIVPHSNLGDTRSSWIKDRPGTDAMSETKSVKSSVPQLPSARREAKEVLSAWGFQGDDVKRAFNHRLAKRKARKMKDKETTADERLARFHRLCD